ncbi:MAG TPA: sugar phosphate isomerase/epimerase family protein, partial [Terriglobia bacterium]|nr:sugar phosphate isomerase/epimerase family protein [Terriglobia bacterium]
MNRRSFVRKLAGAAGAAGVAGVSPRKALPAPPAASTDAGHASAPYKVSLMLWTVFPHLTFEERLEKVADAGYQSVELVNEFRQWSAEDYRRVLRKKHELGMEFDASAGLSRSLIDPKQRQAFLAEVQGMIPILDKLECSTLIILPGDLVPGMPRVDQYQSCVDGLKRAADLIDGKNLRLLIENIDPEENPRFYMTSVAEGFKIVRAVNHPRIRLLYDL